MMTKRLTELEGAVLGMIHCNRDCTPYMVRQATERSRSSYFSGSAGAIYPLIRRLEVRGLIKLIPSTDDGRGSKHCRITSKGLKALQGWIDPPDGDGLVSVSFDPLRTRLLFLEALSPKEQISFLTAAGRRLEIVIKQQQDDLKLKRETGTRWEIFATEGALAVARARRSWIRDTLGQLVESPD